MIYRARAVLTMDGEPIANGAVAISGNRIVDVGPWPEVRARQTGGAVDLGERALLPGLINAHCHLDYTALRGAIAPSSSFSGWIAEINARKAALQPADYLRSIEEGFAEAAAFGTTTMANLEAFPELIGRVDEVPLRTWWFAEMIDVRAPVAVADVLAELEKSARGLGGVGLAPHAPFTASRQLFQSAGELMRARDLPLTTHLAESAEEMAMFRDGTGPLFELLKKLGRAVDDCGAGITPLGLMLREGLLGARWIIAHLNELTPDDWKLLEDAPRFSVVHCPRSHAYFRHTPFALEKLRALGFSISIGTDSLASNDDLSLFREMQTLRETMPSLRAREILEMATVNPAAALGEGQRLGRVRTGFIADLISVPFGGPVDWIWEEVVSFQTLVPWMMLDGCLKSAND